jgi:hypothetical protein
MRPLTLIAAILAGCVAADTNQPTGPMQLVDITLQPARVPPHPNGALMLSAATGCYVEFVGKGAAEPVYRFRIAPTQRVGSLDRCLTSLRAQPGVTAVEVVK